MRKEVVDCELEQILLVENVFVFIVIYRSFNQFYEDLKIYRYLEEVFGKLCQCCYRILVYFFFFDFVDD